MFYPSGYRPTTLFILLLESFRLWPLGTFAAASVCLWHGSLSLCVCVCVALPRFWHEKTFINISMSVSGWTWIHMVSATLTGWHAGHDSLPSLLTCKLTLQMWENGHPFPFIHLMDLSIRLQWTHLPVGATVSPVTGVHVQRRWFRSHRQVAISEHFSSTRFHEVVPSLRDIVSFSCQTAFLPRVLLPPEDFFFKFYIH